MIADTAEREEALDPSRSFIVQAPAGSGKTGLLVQRYLRLLAQVDRPENIVAMTFTRKAAAEMKERIEDALHGAHEGSAAEGDYNRRTRDLAVAALEQDSRQGWHLLGDSSRLQIQTIDSLCALLTRQAPLLSGFGGSLEVVENADDLYRLAARATLIRLAEGTGEDRALLTRLGVYFDNNFVALQDQIVRMLEQREQWRFTATSQGEIIDLQRLLSQAGEDLTMVFRQRGTVDFTAITRAAIDVLGSPEQPSDLLYWLDYRIEHLLVDEFQDTSLAQYELVEALTGQWSEGDEHTLFLVGDPMQSVYAFRGAEVSLFLRSWKQARLGSVRLHPLALRTNFRTTPEILEWVQTKFESIMTGEQTGDVKFRISEASRDAGGKAPKLTALVDDKGEDEAAAAIHTVEAARTRGSVAILVRNRTHLLSILPALRRHDIPYEAIEIDKLTEQQHVIDLLSLTRAILHVGDRVSWLACLRAPWCGLELSDLAALAENERDRTIFDLLSDREKIASLSPGRRLRAVEVQEILSAAVAKMGRLRLRRLVEETWLLLGGPAVLQQPHQMEDVQTYLNLIDNLDEGGAIRDFSLLAERLDCLYAKPSGETLVEVMTVHRAKGLEFDAVVLPHLEGQARQSERDLLEWHEEIGEDSVATLSVAMQPRKGEKDSLYDAIRSARKNHEEQELKRLFYVACTRAKNELYLFGNAKANKTRSDVGGVSHNSFLGLIWESVKPEFQSLLRRQPTQRSLFATEQPGAKTVLRRLAQDWQDPQAAADVDWEPDFQQATASAARQVSYEWVSDTSRHVGIVVHALLKRAVEEKKWSAQRIRSFARTITSELLRLGVADTEAATATERVLRALANIMSSERGRWILAPHAEARSEWPVGGLVGGKLLAGTVDRMFRDDAGRFWIIDFKTSEHEGGRLETFLDEEQRRYREQLESYAVLAQKITHGPIWLGLYFPLLDSWREWQFEEISAGLAAH